MVTINHLKNMVEANEIDEINSINRNVIIYYIYLNSYEQLKFVITL